MSDFPLIRHEQTTDLEAIRSVNKAAFGRADEAMLVEELRMEGAVLGSFVAERVGQIVGHVLFSRTVIDTPGAPVLSVALAPLAVLPSHQRQGVGSELVRAGLDWLRDRRERTVLVLGDPRFYTRFGFSVKRASSLQTPFPADAFMALELVPNALDGIQGTVRYPVAFGL
jgi:putative acetyltransferase